MLPLPYWITVLVTLVAVIVCVTLHYEGLRLLSDKLPVPKHHHRRRIIFLILFLLILHSMEIWVFGISYFLLQQMEGFGTFVGIAQLGLFDCVYYSATVFTTLGFGDIVPRGPGPVYDRSGSGCGTDIYYMVSVIHIPRNAKDLG